MKTRLLFLAIAMMVGLSGPAASALSISVVYSFTNVDGSEPIAALTPGPDGFLYGTTHTGGAFGYGTVFKISTNGNLTTLHSFDWTNGAMPYGGVTLGPDGNFYGTTANGGPYVYDYSGLGTLYRISPTGAWTNLFFFDYTNGGCPTANLTLGPDGYLYGTTTDYGDFVYGQALGNGTIFRVNTNGSLTTVYDFVHSGSYQNQMTNDVFPWSSLTLGPDGNFYGTAEGAHAYDSTSYSSMYYGSVYVFGTNSGFSQLHHFDFTNNGANPFAGLTVGSDGCLYGTTANGGQYAFTNSSVYGGTVFKITTNGIITNLVTFDYTNGATPYGALTPAPDGNLYGTTSQGGASGHGTLFEIDTNGTMTALFSFGGTNGSAPFTGLTLGPDGNYYGTTYSGGANLSGEIYRLGFPPAIPSTNQPPDTTNIIGSFVFASVRATGSAPLAYQWYFNGNPLAGATSSVLTESPFLPGEAGQYQVVVTNAFGSVTSRLATLGITIQPNPYAISNLGGGNLEIFLASFPLSANLLWATTNLSAGPWWIVSTNITDITGLAQQPVTNNGSAGAIFYRLQNVLGIGIRGPGTGSD